ncbi:uncharacterized protein DFL_008100 [Arthrobotrys flagrans]|uniref:Uncharacterized protein n=1 Tax=Arthrobotrys flagrans TaxID=97331 RepID=A0A436ZMV8_ARTFL|nr:hypothetical protein DFL_008100 [Arthrobotrys flagrans]
MHLQGDPILTLSIDGKPLRKGYVSGSATQASQMVGNIELLTAKSMALQAPAKSIPIVNGPLIAIDLGPFPLLGLPKSSRLQPLQSLRCRFAKVHQDFFNILIGKAGLVTVVPIIGSPVAAVIRSLEAIADTVAFGIIDTVEVAVHKASITSDANTLHGTTEVSITAYVSLIPLKKHHARDFTMIDA